MDLQDKLRLNTVPVYLVECSLFLGLNLVEYIGALHIICAVDTFNGMHPNLFVPASFKYNYLDGYEDVINQLLRNQEVIQYIRAHGRGKLITWFLDETSEELARELGLEVCLPPVALRNYWGSKVNTNRLAERAGIPCVPYVLSAVENYSHLRSITAHLGPHLVVQMPHGYGGETTFFISDQLDFDEHLHQITNGEEMRIMKRINCISTGLEACITRYGIVTSPLLLELINIPELNLYSGGWSGNQLTPNTFSESIRTAAQDYALRMGQQLQQVGYKGYFEIDFLIDKELKVLYLGEINLRFCGFTSMLAYALISQQELPPLLYHLAEWLDISYNLDNDDLTQRWMTLLQGSSLSFLYMHNVSETSMRPIPSGVYRMDSDERVVFDRLEVSIPHLNSDEIFWLNVAPDGQVLQKGHEVGGLFLPGRANTDAQGLNATTQAWIRGLRQISDARFSKQQ
jgi:hypothetical protein